MRIWSLHPSYLDTKGLLAAWREGLLAYHVLLGNTKGYKNHPQLIRFKEHPKPVDAITAYLHAIVDEAEKRGYKFKREKLPSLMLVDTLVVTKGQLAFESEHLLKKLFIRDKNNFEVFKNVHEVQPHPLFTVVKGEVSSWEKN